jgi:glycosyltransferase involved in cell wall biosynthesis
MARVEVVIPTRDRCALLREAVASIQRQTLEDWGVVVVDDASTDGTSQWLDSLAGREERVQTVRLESHSERATARNRGLELVTSPFVLFLDDDDRLTPRALEQLVGALNAHLDAVEAIGARVAFDDEGHRRRAHHVRVRMTRPVWPEMLAGWFAVPGQCLFRTERLRSAGGWSEQIAGPEDQELQLRLSTLGPAVFVPATVLEYRAHSGQWRPYDAGLVEESIHQEFAVRLEGNDRDRAMRLRRAHAILFGPASEAHNQGQYRRALTHYLRAVHEAPGILTLPLAGPPLASRIGKAFAGRLLGRRISRRLRSVLGSGRRALRRDPGGGAEKAVASSSARRESG